MLADDFQNQITPPLDIPRVVSQSLQMVWRRRSDMARAVVVPAMGQIITGVVSARLGIEHLRYQVPLGLAQMVFVTALAVAVHRILLLGQGSVSSSYVLSSWTPRETRYLGRSLAMLAIAIVLLWLPVRVLRLGMLLGLPDPWGLFSVLSVPFFAGVSIYVLSRLSQVLPSMAIDEQHNFRWAWNRSRGHGWRLLVVVGLFPGVFFWWARTFIERGQPMLVNGLVYTAWVAVLVVTIATLSLAYQTLTQAADLMLVR